MEWIVLSYEYTCVLFLVRTKKITVIVCTNRTILSTMESNVRLRFISLRFFFFFNFPQPHTKPKQEKKTSRKFSHVMNHGYDWKRRRKYETRFLSHQPTDCPPPPSAAPHLGLHSSIIIFWNIVLVKYSIAVSSQSAYHPLESQECLYKFPPHRKVFHKSNKKYPKLPFEFDCQNPIKSKSKGQKTSSSRVVHNTQSIGCFFYCRFSRDISSQILRWTQHSPTSQPSSQQDIFPALLIDEPRCRILAAEQHSTWTTITVISGCPFRCWPIRITEVSERRSANRNAMRY